MPQLILTKDQVIQVKVTSIKENVKTVQKKEGIRFRHDITVEAESGDTLKCEYLSPRDKVGDDFVPNVYQYIRCVYPERDGATIEPAEPPTQRTHTSISQELEKKAEKNIPDIDCSTLNISGSSIAFAMAWGKDLVVADIAARPYKEVTEDDVKKMLEFGVKINDGICDFLKFN